MIPNSAPRGILLQVCEVLGLDPKLVHRIDIQPDKIIVERHYGIVSDEWWKKDHPHE